MNKLLITVKHKCGHVQLHVIEAKDETDVARYEAVKMHEYCDDCKEAIQKHNEKFPQNKV
jgi:hypothetical protein